MTNIKNHAGHSNGPITRYDDILHLYVHNYYSMVLSIDLSQSIDMAYAMSIDFQ